MVHLQLVVSIYKAEVLLSDNKIKYVMINYCLEVKTITNEHFLAM